MKKKILCVVSVFLLLLSMAACGKTEEKPKDDKDPEQQQQQDPVVQPKSVNAMISISSEGKVVLCAQMVTATDLDNDGVVTIDEALQTVHELFCKDGYQSEVTEYGISMVSLWGVKNGGAYGYYLNHTSPQSLKDEIHDGDVVEAYSYQDTATYADVYSFFDQTMVTAAKDQDVTLTLSAVTFNANWEAVTDPLSGAALQVNGETVSTVTGDDGTAVLHFSEPGEYQISAVKDGMVLVPPMSRIIVSG